MNSSKALIIDRSKSAQIGLRKKLQAFDFDVDLASSGLEAINRLTESSQQLPNIIFLNRHLSEMEWLEITKKIKSNPSWQNITIVMCSGQSSQELKQQAIESGIDAVIPKPASREQIKEIIINLGIEEINITKPSNKKTFKHKPVRSKNQRPGTHNRSKQVVDSPSPQEEGSNSQGKPTIKKVKKSRSTLLDLEKHLTASLDARTKHISDEILQSLEMRTKQIVSPVLMPLIDATIKEQLSKNIEESALVLEQSLLNRFQLEFSALSKGFWEKTNLNLLNVDKNNSKKTGELIEKTKNEIAHSLNLEINNIKNEISNDKTKRQIKNAISLIRHGQNNTTGQITSIVNETKRLGLLSNDLDERCEQHSKTISSLVAHSTDMHHDLKQLDSRIEAAQNESQHDFEQLDALIKAAQNESQHDLKELDARIDAAQNDTQHDLNRLDSLIDATQKDILCVKDLLENNSLDHKNFLEETEKLTLNQKLLQESVDDLKKKFHAEEPTKNLIQERSYSELNDKICTLDNRLLGYEEELSLISEAATKMIEFESLNHDKKATNSESKNFDYTDNRVKTLDCTVSELESKLATLSDSLRESQVMYMILASDPNNLDTNNLNEHIKESAEIHQKKMALDLTDQISSELEKSVVEFKQDVQIKLDFQDSKLKTIMRTIYGTLGLSTIVAMALYILKMSY